MSTKESFFNAEFDVVKDAFFSDGEKEHFRNLLMTDRYSRFINFRLIKQNPTVLFAHAKELISRIENGEFTEKQMEEAEFWVGQYLLAIKSIQFEKEKGCSEISKDVIER